MSLLLTFVGVTAALTALFWAGGLFLQGYLFGQPADRLPLRAAAGAALLGAFMTFWTYVNTRAESADRYGTFFEFNPTAEREVTEFEAVRRLNSKGADGAWAEQTVPFKRPAGRTADFTEGGNPAHKFRLNAANFMTVAVLVPEPNGGEKVRFEAELDKTGVAYRSQDKLFREARGSRYLYGETPGRVYAPSTLAAVGALLLNVAHFGLWFVVFWPILRFGSGLSAGMAAACGLAAMLVVMPLLFNSNHPKAAPAAAATR